jgi:universal stress protein A
MSLYKTMLVAVDLSDQAETVLTKAQELAELHGASLDVVSVAEMPVSGLGALAGHPVGGEMQLREEIHAALDKLVKDSGKPVKKIHALLGHPASSITDLGEKLGIDLLVVGSHGRHGLRALLGSTANAVLHGSEVDVLLIRIPG